MGKIEYALTLLQSDSIGSVDTQSFPYGCGVLRLGMMTMNRVGLE